MLFIARISAPVIPSGFLIMATKISYLRRQPLRAHAAAVERLESKFSELSFIHPSYNDSRSFILSVMMDEGIEAAEKPKGDHGHIVFRCFGNIFHLLHWSSHRHRRITRSRSTTDVSSAAIPMLNRL